MKAHVLSWALGWMVLLTTAGTAMAKDDGQPVTKRPLGERLPTYHAPAAPDTLQEPADTLRLRDALALSLMHNPRLSTKEIPEAHSEGARSNTSHSWHLDHTVPLGFGSMSIDQLLIVQSTRLYAR